MPKPGFEALKDWADLTADRDFFHCIYTFFKADDDLSISVETKVFLKKDCWQISCWSDKFTKAANWLRAHGIAAKRIDQATEGWLYLELPFDSSPEVVAQKYQELISQISATAHRRVAMRQR